MINQFNKDLTKKIKLNDHYHVDTNFFIII